MRQNLVGRGLLAAAVLGGGILYVTGADPVSNAVRRAKSQAVRADQQQREKYAKALQKSQEALQKDRQQLTAAMSELATARNALKLAGMHKKQVHEEATHRAEQKLGLVNARDEQEAARKALDEAGRPVLEELRGSPDYKAAVAKADQAKSLLSARANENPPEGAAQHQTAVMDSLAVERLERETLATDSRTSSLVTQLEAARTTVADLHRAVQKSAKEDHEVRTAQRQFVDARRELETQIADVSTMRQRIAAAETRLNQGIPHSDSAKSPPRSKSPPKKPKAG